MSRYEDPDDDLIEYDDAIDDGDRGEACARLRQEFGDWDEPVTHAQHCDVSAEPLPLWDLRSAEGRLERLDPDGIWRPLWQ